MMNTLWGLADTYPTLESSSVHTSASYIIILYLVVLVRGKEEGVCSSVLEAFLCVP